jgi:hypothetical protein
MSEKYIQKFHRMYWVQRLDPVLRQQYLTRVVCVPLSPILEKILQVPHINLLVLDLEGAEYLVLEELFRSTSANGEEGAGAGRRVRVDPLR